MSRIRKTRDVRSSDAPQNRKLMESVRVKAEKDRAKAEEKRAKALRSVLSHETHRDPPSSAGGEAGGGSGPP